MDAKGSTGPASYINKIRSPPDWGIIFKAPESTSLKKDKNETSSEYSLLEDFAKTKALGLQSKLDVTQLEAVELALREKVALIQVSCMQSKQKLSSAD